MKDVFTCLQAFRTMSMAKKTVGDASIVHDSNGVAGMVVRRFDGRFPPSYPVEDAAQTLGINFEQFNRFLKMQSSRRPDPLLKSQQALIWDGVGTSKKFREHPGFAWLVHSRFAGTAPEVDKALERIAKAQGLE
ncbi:hypothetical protein [Corynebacterium mayonis]|uniref:hypothetical protein n=1 Tax=Corynebacterium mayonis TaxID=3062461 RepID=UPI0031400EED